MTDCSICTESYTIRTRKEVTCPQCNFTCCLQCLKRFILSSATEPACMSCKVQFSYEFILEQLPNTFWNNEYKQFRKNLLLSHEESLLPDTQDIVMRIRCKDNMFQYLTDFNKKIVDMQKIYRRMLRIYSDMNNIINNEIHHNIEVDENHPLFRFFDEECKPLKDENGNLLALKKSSDELENRLKKGLKPQVSSWIHACPNPECRGFLKGDQEICTICQKRCCPKCLVLLDSIEHECKTDDLETMTLLKQNTKPCPQCSMAIYKISGCDQMWCTQCKTPFSWKTGLKINQVIHNPHYYEWMQQRGGNNVPRELMDVPCGGLPELYQLDIIFKKGREREWIYTIHRQIIHTEQVLIPRSQRFCNEDNNLKEMRINYLLQSLTKDQWRDELYRKEKIIQKHRQYLQLLQTFVAVLSDWMRRLVIENVSNTKPEIDYIQNFLAYLDQQVFLLNKRFKSDLSSPSNGLIL